MSAQEEHRMHEKYSPPAIGRDGGAVFGGGADRRRSVGSVCLVRTDWRRMEFSQYRDQTIRAAKK